jgi:hypothetical protein
VIGGETPCGRRIVAGRLAIEGRQIAKTNAPSYRRHQVRMHRMAKRDPFPGSLFKGVGRNDPCPCGSGRKFKKCCLGKSEFEFGGAGALPKSSDTLPSAHLGEEYDPLIEPNAAEWLALDEQERIDLVVAYHEFAGIRVPNATAHAIIHAVVENQIAEGDTLPVKRTAQRLMREGLDRHDAIHAIGSVLVGHMNDLMREVRSNVQSAGRDSDADPNTRYFAELEHLTADGWRRSA